MFIMVSSSHFQVAPQADGHLGGQLACAAMYYGVFSTIVNITKGGCGCYLRRKRREEQAIKLCV
jgi:hypothetical protein